jgi:hypothetical protein
MLVIFLILPLFSINLIDGQSSFSTSITSQSTAEFNSSGYRFDPSMKLFVIIFQLRTFAAINTLLSEKSVVACMPNQMEVSQMINHFPLSKHMYS